ncbi:plant UBX domain-containing protein 11 isoform X2 [Apium graveolens]|uniref:plant UBX domain-containing protein 11 isoform X2 n=1 Tax=Apium graveolens TaxID=4045 RepID=UPI003D7BEE61
MEQSISSLAFKGSVTEAIFEAKRQKKLFVVYISGENLESSNLEKSTWTDLNLAEVISKYCILLQILEGSADAANLSAIYAQKSPPCITVIGYNGLQLWQNGLLSAEVLASSLEKAWLNLHLQETAASVLTAALATQKTELLAQGNSGYNLPGQRTSSSSDAPSPLTDNHIPNQGANSNTPTDFKSVDEKEHLPAKKSNLEVGNDISPAPENEHGSTHAEQASPSKVNELIDPVKMNPENIVNDKVGCPVQEANLVDLRSEAKKLTLEGVGESKSAGQAKSADDYKNDDRDFSINKSDVHLNIRLPDCTSLQEKFSLTSILREVKNYLDEKQEISMRSYDLAIPYPRKVFGNDDLNKTLSELGLSDRQALILVPHSKIGGYPREGSVSRHQTSANQNIDSSNGSSEGYFSYVKNIISYVNPFSYIGGGTNPPSPVHESQSSTWQFRPTTTPENSLRNAGPNQSASASDGNRKRPASSRFGSNIHTLKHDEDDKSKTKDRNAFWNGNSTQYGGDSDGK